ncbi:hypothetical protein B0H15DRAFT_994164 [Mycena belliarum]|uniref:DUF6699 domain-containing protein n=1 Tax=Mycena belliarum TaxID=1033014 RepID=A0AAD6TZQ8_9AGAR|nr:hypothetical protein B0H15DRAFT_994164 [Mycena belliae]
MPVPTSNYSSLPLPGHNPAPPELLAVPPHSRPLYACTELLLFDEEPRIKLHAVLDPESAPGLDIWRDPVHQLPPPAALSAPATTPPRAGMKLTCPRLPWRIALASAPGGFVYILASPVVDRPVIAMAFEERCTQIRRGCDPEAAWRAEMERKRGIRRVDFLFGSPRFVGLAATPGRPDEWQMIFSA